MVCCGLGTSVGAYVFCGVGAFGAMVGLVVGPGDGGALVGISVGVGVGAFDGYGVMPGDNVGETVGALMHSIDSPNSPSLLAQPSTSKM